MSLYIAPWEAQLPERNGGSLCSAVAGARLTADATKGRIDTTGEHIRSLTNEPIPDPRSPGLNMPQIHDAIAKLGVYMDVRIGSRAVAWDEYERRRMEGQGCFLQIGYGPIADSPMDAGTGFRGGHAIFETLHATYDSLADGRRSGVWRFDGRVYDRPLIRKAAGALPIPTSRGISHPQPGFVWAGFSVDVVPDYVADIRALPGDTWRKVALYTVRDGRIVSYKASRTTAMHDPCSPPQPIRVPTGGYRYLVQLHAGVWAGSWVWAGFSHEGS